MTISYAQIVREVREVVAVSCDECGRELKPAIPDHGFGKFPQADDALVIEAHGGFGMYHDSIDGTPTVIWCHDCIDRIRGLVPSLDRALTPPSYEPDDD